MEIKLNASKIKWRINSRELIKNFFDFNWGSAITEVVEVEKDIECLAFLLLFQTTRNTVSELLQKFGQTQLDNNYHLVSENLNFEKTLKEFFEKEITLDKNFFINILEYSPKYLTDSFLIFKEYAKILQIELPISIRNIYYLRYAENLEYEYQEKKEKYKKLIEYFENPMSVVKDKYGNLLEYYAIIKKYYSNKQQQNIEERAETLKDLYIEPNFLIFKNNLNKSKGNKKFVEANLNIHEFINNYYLKDVHYPDLKKEYNMLFLLGQPGQGKTSFCYKVIYDYLESNLDLPHIPIFFVKIRELVAKDFINNPFDILTKHLHNNINFSEDKGFLILDGLDEAYMSGGITDSDLKNLYDRLNKWKWTNPKIKIILTSRENYLNINDSCIDDSLVLKLDVFSNEQVLEYKNKYLFFYPDNQFINNVDLYVDNANTIEYQHLNELIRQPVILYFIALSNIDINKSNSRSEIYNRIFNSLAERSWDKQKGQLDFIKKNISPDVYQRHLREYIRSIAFSIYQSPNLYITIKDLTNLDSTKSFINKCFEDDFTNDSRNFMDLTKYLLISFYFQESNKASDEAAIEFFHNSIWEYLTAEYFWEKFKDLFLSTNRNGDYKDIDINEYFDLLTYLIGDKSFKGMVDRNVQEIILNENVAELVLLIDRSKKVFYSLSNNDFLLRYSRDTCKLTAIEKITSIFWLSFIYLGFACKKVGRILVLDSDLTNHYTKNIPKGVISLFDNSFNYISFSWFDRYFYLSSSELSYLIFNDSISGVSFQNCSLKNIVFNDCYISEVKFYNSEFNNVTFDNIKIEKTGEFEKCSFKECSFINIEFDTKQIYENFIKNNVFEKEFNPKVSKNDKKIFLTFQHKNYDKNYNDVISRQLKIL
ncbi:NACHT domain-containing protein [Chryseobacterium sp. EZn1]|uniref:NACHT domain-containing protein n=1 Tax=Chryseobacterium cupriresistens TaxID=3366770 RepID=UPI00398530F9